MLTLATVSVMILFLLFAAYYRHWVRQFDNMDEKGLSASVERLLTSGYDGAIMIIRDMSSERFVQFRKYIGGPGEIGLETHFPLAPWSQQYYSTLIDALKQKNIAFDFVPGDPHDPTTEFVHIDFGADASQASEWAIDVFKRVFGCSKVCVSVRADDLDPQLGRVERRDHPRATLRRRPDQRRPAKG